MTQSETTEISTSKATLRSAGRRSRAGLSAGERQEKSHQLCARLLRLWRDLTDAQAECSGQPVAVYLANQSEADVDGFARELLNHGLVVAAPRLNIVPPFYTLEGALQNVEIVAVGARQNWVRQPHRFQGGHAVEASEIGVFIVPGVAFDAHGNRVGQGSGWYDKVLCKAPHAIVIGVGFDCQVFPAVPQEAHDCALHYVVTESRIMHTGARLSS